MEIKLAVYVLFKGKQLLSSYNKHLCDESGSQTRGKENIN